MKSAITVNPILNVTATQYIAGAEQYVAKQLFPTFPTPLQAAAYYVFDAENMLNIPQLVARAAGAPYSRGRIQAKQDTYNTRDYGHEEVVDDRERKKYASALAADIAAVRRIMRVILMNQENRAYALATSAAVPNSAVTTKWDQAGSHPFADTNPIREVIRVNTGLLPNLMLISEPTFNVLSEHPDILDKIKYTQRGIVTEDIIAAAFRVGKLVVARAVANSANEGQTTTPADLWGKDAIFAYVDPSPDLSMPTFGRIFSWTEEVGSEGTIVESYRDDEVRGDVHRVRNDADEKLVVPAAGYRLTGVIT